MAVLLFYLLANISTLRAQRYLMALLSGTGAAGSLWFAAAQDWAQDPAKLGTVTRLGIAFQAVLPRLPGEWLNTNIVAGVLAVLALPSLGLALGTWCDDCVRP